MDHGDIMLNLFLGNEAGWRTGEHPFAPTRGGGGDDSAARSGQSGILSKPTSAGCLPVGSGAILPFACVSCWRNPRPRGSGTSSWKTREIPAVTCDLIHTQDIGLAHYGAIRLNEYYVSQYVDHSPLDHPDRGCAVASRQNQSMGGRCPWTVIGSLGRGVAYATDALQFHGLATRAGGPPVALTSGLPGKRLQHEHSMVSIQDEPIVLAPGAKARSGFFGWFEADKQTATSADDVKKIDAALALPEAAPPRGRIGTEARRRPAACFQARRSLESLPLDEAAVAAFFGGELAPRGARGRKLLSFFTGDRSHVVLKPKELKVLRPHGHLLRSGGSLIPDESALTSTAWMNGVFHSMVTQGHVSINRFLSTCHTYLGLFRSHGQRVFVEIDGVWHLLAVPSAFAMAPDSCRWIYQHRGGLIEVVSTAPDDKHELRLAISVLEGPPARFLISHHVAINGDDGSRAIPVRWKAEGNGVFVRAVPDSDVGRRFP